MKISIITACLNNEKTIEDCLKSVSNQTYKNIEHIIIDGKSTDNTLEIIKTFNHISTTISETDSGIYYALNKGILLAQGDVIGFLHADDFLADDRTIERIAEKFQKKQNLEAVYGDLIYISSKQNQKKIRYWKSKEFSPQMIKRGWMPPHPTLYIKKEIYNNYGQFDTKYKISADYDLIVRFLKKKIKIEYIPEIIVKMRIGGKSNKNFKNIIQKSKEDYQIIRENEIGNIITLLNKNLMKISQFLK